MDWMVVSSYLLNEIFFGFLMGVGKMEKWLSFFLNKKKQYFLRWASWFSMKFFITCTQRHCNHHFDLNLTPPSLLWLITLVSVNFLPSIFLNYFFQFFHVVVWYYLGELDGHQRIIPTKYIFFWLIFYKSVEVERLIF